MAGNIDFFVDPSGEKKPNEVDFFDEAAANKPGFLRRGLSWLGDEAVNAYTAAKESFLEGAKNVASAPTGDRPYGVPTLEDVKQKGQGVLEMLNTFGAPIMSAGGRVVKALEQNQMGLEKNPDYAEGLRRIAASKPGYGADPMTRMMAEANLRAQRIPGSDSGGMPGVPDLTPEQARLESARTGGEILTGLAPLPIIPGGGQVLRLLRRGGKTAQVAEAIPNVIRESEQALFGFREGEQGSFSFADRNYTPPTSRFSPEQLDFRFPTTQQLDLPFNEIPKPGQQLELLRMTPGVEQPNYSGLAQTDLPLSQATSRLRGRPQFNEAGIALDNTPMVNARPELPTRPEIPSQRSITDTLGKTEISPVLDELGRPILKEPVRPPEPIPLGEGTPVPPEGALKSARDLALEKNPRGEQYNWLKERMGLNGESGMSTGQALTSAPVRALVGGGVGSLAGDTPEERIGGAMVGAGIGLGAPYALRALRGMRGSAGEVARVAEDTPFSPGKVGRAVYVPGGSSATELPEKLGRIGALRGTRKVTDALEDARDSVRGVMEGDKPLTTTGKVPGINLDTIRTTDDVRNAVSTLAEGGKDLIAKARGPKATNESVIKAANESGLSVRDLLAHHKDNPFNKTQVEAYKNLALNASDEFLKTSKAFTEGRATRQQLNDAIDKGVTVLGAYARGRAETGRALQAFKIPTQMRDAIAGMTQTIGHEWMTPAMANTIMTRAINPTWWDKVHFFRLSGMLTAFSTHAVNALTNTISAGLVMPLSHAASRGLANSAHTMTGIRVALTEGVPLAMKDMIQRHTLEHGHNPFVKRVGDEMVATRAGKIIGGPVKALSWSDQQFKSIIATGELYSQAHLKLKGKAVTEGWSKAKFSDEIRKLASDPTTEMVNQAWEQAQYRTFNKKLGNLGSRLSAVRSGELDRIHIKPLQALVPFMQTPLNYFKQGLEHSPLGFAGVALEGRKLMRGEISKQAFKDSAVRPMLGTAALIAGYVAMKAVDGEITGFGPTDPARRAVWLTTHTPYTISAFGKSMSHERFDPGIIGTIADIAYMWDHRDEMNFSKDASTAVFILAHDLLNKTYFQSAADTVLALADPERYGIKWTNNIASSVVPTGIGSVARALDPTARRANDPLEAIQGKLPGATQGLSSIKDIFGRDVERPGGAGISGAIQRVASPAIISNRKSDEVGKELESIGAGIQYPPKVIGDHSLSNKEYDAYQQLSGQYLHENLKEEIQSGGWREMDTETKHDTVKRAVVEARSRARQDLVDRGLLSEKVLEKATLADVEAGDADAATITPRARLRLRGR